jgi:hypothetical protein
MRPLVPCIMAWRLVPPPASMPESMVVRRLLGVPSRPPFGAGTGLPLRALRPWGFEFEAIAPPSDCGWPLVQLTFRKFVVEPDRTCLLPLRGGGESAIVVRRPPRASARFCSCQAVALGCLRSPLVSRLDLEAKIAPPNL